jgi:hypothetical protein
VLAEQDTQQGTAQVSRQGAGSSAQGVVTHCEGGPEGTAALAQSITPAPVRLPASCY